MDSNADRHYLIFWGGGEDRGHSVVYFIKATSVEAAMRQYVTDIYGDVEFHADGSLTDNAWGKKRLVQHPHILSYIEANEKVVREWQIRELPDWAWHTTTCTVFCGESSDGVDSLIRECCRPLLRKEFPTSRARAFVWYVNDGALVTFYYANHRHPGRYTVLRRYLVRRENNFIPEPWDGDYAALCSILVVKQIPDEQPKDGWF